MCFVNDNKKTYFAFFDNFLVFRGCGAFLEFLYTIYEFEILI